MKRKPFTRSAATDALVRYLAAFEHGTQLTYTELSSAAGEDITPRSGKLQSVFRILLESHAQVWVLVPPQVGVKRLGHSEIAARDASLHINGARSKLRRGGKIAAQVDAQQLDKDGQVKFSVNCFVRELALQTLSTKTRNRAERVVRGTSNDLPKFDLVEWAVSLSPRQK